LGFAGQLSVATSGVAADDSVLLDLEETSSVYSETSTLDRWIQDTSITSLGSEGTPSRPHLQLIDVSDGQLPPDLTSDMCKDSLTLCSACYERCKTFLLFLSGRG